MKKKSCRVLAVLLMLALVVSTAACGKSETTSGKTVMDKNHVFKEKELEFDLEGNSPGRCIVSGDRIYFLYTEYPEYTDEGVDIMPLDADEDMLVKEPEEEPVEEPVEEFTEDTNGVLQHFVSFKLDGTDRQEFIIDNYDVNTWINQMAVSESGEYCFINCSYNSYYDDNGEYIYEELYTLCCVNAEGNGKWSYDLSGDTRDKDGNSLYIRALYIVDNMALVMYGDGMLRIDMTNGNKIDYVPLLEEYETAFCGTDGRLIINKWVDQGYEYYTYDVASGKLSDKIEVPKEFDTMTVYGTGVYDLYLGTTTELYGYNFGDAELTEVMDYIDSDLMTSYLSAIYVLDEENILISYYDYESYKEKYSLMTKVNPEDVKDKIVLTIACYYLNDSIRRHLVDFNKSNDTYRISIKDYSMYDNYENDTYTSGTTQLNNDIIAGKVPDILIGNSDLPMSIYQSKGLLTDLYDLMEKDSSINKEDYLTNVFEAYEYNGKLTCIPTSFYIITAIAKTSLVGDRMNWTISEMQSILNGMGSDVQLFSDITRDDFLTYCTVFNGSQWIDWEKGECFFDSTEFVDLLKFCKTLPKEINWDEKYEDDNYWVESQYQYRENRTLCSYRYLSDFRSYEYARQGEFGEDISFIGFPTTGDIGSVITSNFTFSISSKCKYKDGAWEFIRYFMQPEYQETIYGWPILRSEYDRLIAEAKERPYWEDENGEKHYYDDSYWFGDTEIAITPCTDESIERVMSLLESVNRAYVRDENWISIVEEESKNYFEGSKSPEEVAKVIQSRVNIYVNESK